MAPTPNLAAANLAYGQAVARLQSACVFLDRQLPPVDNQEVEVVPAVPALRPKQRAASVPNCVECEQELQDQSPGRREGHRCTHRVGDEVVEPVGNNTFPDTRAPRRRQPNSGVIKQDLQKLEQKFDSFTGAIGTLISLMEPNDAERYESHMVIWADYVGWLQDRAEDLICILDAATKLANSVNTNVIRGNSAANNTPVVPQPGGSRNVNEIGVDDQPLDNV